MADDIINLRAEQTIDTIKQLIRYDIPCLILGPSSVGKSFSLIGLADRWRLKKQMLYIGSEKPENIEGLPKLHAVGEKLEYFKPYWFPSSEQVTDIVKNGRTLFNRFIADYFTGKFTYNYENLYGLLEGISSTRWTQADTKKSIIIPRKSGQFNTEPFEVEREIISKQDQKEEKHYRDDIRDLCCYITTLLGYGNFWLILDEIDKVSEFDVDKYAPLLHIVRERYLKGWNLVEVNDNKGINIPTLVTNGDYSVVKEIIDRSIENGQSLLDTRVIAIANATDNIEEALFRRFAQVFVEDVLVVDKPDVAALTLKRCLSEQGLQEDLEVPPHNILSELNLQWVFNFFVKLINRGDITGNYFYRDALTYITDHALKGLDSKSNEYFDKYVEVLAEKSAIYRLILSNFQRDDKNQEFQLAILRCLARFYLAGATGDSVSLDKNKVQRDKIEEYMTELDGDVESVSLKVMDDLKKNAPTKEKDPLAMTNMLAWIDDCYTYIYVTMFSEKGVFNQTELNKILIPLIQEMILSTVADNSNIDGTNTAAIMTNLGERWLKFKEYFGKIKTVGVSKATEAVYGSENKITEGSASYNLANKYSQRIFLELNIRSIDGKLGEILNVADEGFYKFIKEKHKEKALKLANILRKGVLPKSKPNPVAGDALDTFLR